MQRLLNLRLALDDVIGPVKRARLFTHLFSGHTTRLAVGTYGTITEAEYVAQRLRYLDVPATVHQQVDFPYFHVVWVTL